MIIAVPAAYKNHPCVVMWSLANESDTTTFPESSVEYYSTLYDLAKACDPEKPPTSRTNTEKIVLYYW